MHAEAARPRSLSFSVFVVDGDDGVDLHGDEADERGEAGLDGERGEGGEAEHRHQRVQDQALLVRGERGVLKWADLMRICAGNFDVVHIFSPMCVILIVPNESQR